jgi:hypothetical protein
MNIETALEKIDSLTLPQVQHLLQRVEFEINCYEKLCEKINSTKMDYRLFLHERRAKVLMKLEEFQK